MTPAPQSRPAAVLFDLDGTLVDSAPDLADAANELLADHGRPALSYEALRVHVGSGARGMIGAGFGLSPADAGYEPLRAAFIERYERRLLARSAVFDGVLGLLQQLQGAGVRCGVVTNKARRLAEPLVRGVGLEPWLGTLVGGDCAAHPKPHPAPLLLAAERLRLAPESCVYVGDDRRDILAGRAAGMRTVAATWGYLGPGEDPRAWPADAWADLPAQVLQCAGLA